MNTLENKFYQFKSKFENLSKDKQIKIFNDFCDKNGFKKSKIYPISKFDEVFANVKPSEIVEMVYHHRDMVYHHRDMINPTDAYFIASDYGFITSNNPYNDIIQYYLIDIFVSMGDNI